MKLTQKNLNFLSQCAIEAALRAGDIIRHYANKKVSHRFKSDTGSLAANIVTEVDLLVQQEILKILSESSQRYDLAMLTEESEDDKSRLDKDYFWCIDPMDGTLYFSESEPGYSVSIALVSKNGESMLGVIYDPVEEKLYSAVNGQESLINQMPVNRITADDHKTMTIFCDRHYLQHKEYNELIERLTKILKKEGYHSIKIVANGGAVKSAVSVLEYAPACYFKWPKKVLGGGCLWDYAASNCFFQDGKVVATDMTGNKLDLNPTGSIYMNHCGIVFASNQKIADCIYHLYQL